MPILESSSLRIRWLVLAFVALGSGACAGEPAEEVAQPIAFDHQKHIDIEMTCTQCHPGAEQQARAGLVPIASCATCHRTIVADHPEVVKLMEYFDRGEPIMWRKVNALPSVAMVHFKHKPHARAGVECSTCHGEVAQMTVARRVVNTADMRWCVDCHQQSGAEYDCLSCHR